MSQQFVAEIRLFACNFAPRGWALCNGQLLAISQNAALFSLLGTTFGGNGTSTFGLPNMQGNMPMDWGNSVSGPAAGLNRTIGETNGSYAISVLNSNLPPHSHVLNASLGVANSPDPSGTLLAAPLRDGPLLYNDTPPNTVISSALALAGGGQSLSRAQPYLVLNFCIALQGIFPSRN